MALISGTRLGPYEIVSAIGAGGMGEVYRAKDTRLNRTVAIKILPPAFQDRPDHRERFEREARVVSSLSHPHICALYDVGREQGTDFLVIEYLEGETLAQRLLRGPLPPNQALRYAIEIADALDHAHRHGVVHRDLKPGNVMLTRAGSKLLDFGLAKLRPVASGPTDGTITIDGAPITAQGAIVGTFQYMAPEQVEGKESDARTDIFAFGIVLYEMATGRKPFEGGTAASLIAAILERDPPSVSSLQPLSPQALDRVVARCLAKDPDDRWQTARDLMLELKWIAESAPSAPTVSRRPTTGLLRLVAAAGLGVLLGVGLAVGVGYLRRAPVEDAAVRLSFSPPENVKLADLVVGGPVTISPDGRLLAFVASGPDGKQLLWIRPLDSLASQALPGTDGAGYPFWSPDSRFIGFFAQGRLKRIAAGGGPSRTLCDATLPRGGTWNDRGEIVFSANAGTELLHVVAAGGTATPLTIDRPNPETYWPSFLPDGRHFVYVGRSQRPGIYLASLDSKDTTLLVRDAVGVAYAPPGYLVVLTGSSRGSEAGTLVAQPFDANRLAAAGEPAPLVEQVAYRSIVASGAFAVSANGTLIYGGLDSRVHELTWLDRQGQRLGSVGGAAAGYRSPVLSPDERTLAVERHDAGQAPDIWLIETTRNVASRLTVDPAQDFMPVWSPDGTRIVFTSPRDGHPPNLHHRLSNGGGQDELVLRTSRIHQPTDWSRDGRFIVYATLDPKTQWDLWLLPMQPEVAVMDRKPVPFLQSEFNEHNGQFSPDGRWMAYASDESGTWEVYVRALPASSARWLVSTKGGSQPRWRGDGRELFYIAADGTLMAVPVNPATSFQANVPEPLFRTRIAGPGPPALYITNYDVSGDGQRFLINTVVQEASPPTAVVLNWPATLRR